MPPLHWLDYAIIAGYLLLSLVIGLLAGRRTGPGSESYFLGDRRLPWWLNGISLAATSFASDTPLVITEMVRGRGLQRLWWLFAGVLALVVAIYVFSRLWRRLEAITDAEFCELRYDGPAAGVLRAVRAFLSGIVANLITIAWVTLGMGAVISVVLPVDQWVAIQVAMIVTVAYTVFGGFRSAVLTDLLQFVIALGAMLLFAVIAVHEYGGLASVLAAVREAPGYGERTLSLLPRFDHANLDLACFLILLTLWWTDTGGHVMQRMSACRTERDAARAMLFFAIWQAVRPWMWAAVALVSIAVFPVMTAPYTDMHAYPLVLDRYLGLGLRGLLVAAFAAAFMSTITTHLNWGASYLVRDGYCRFFRPAAPEREQRLVSRLMTVLLAGAGLLLTPLLGSLTAAWEFLALLPAGFGIISVLRWFWWRVNAWTELSVLAAGLVFAGFDLALRGWAPGAEILGLSWGEWRYELKLLLFTSIAVIVALVVTLRTPPVSREQLRRFNRKVRPGGWWGPVEAGEDPRGLPEPVLTRRTALDCLGGLALCLGLTTGIGYGLLLQPGPAALAFGLAAIGAVQVHQWLRNGRWT